MLRPTLIATLILVILLARPALGFAAILTVTDFGDSGAPGQFRTLINTAAPGDTIMIPAATITLTGAANEDANASGDLDILKNLTIQGAGPGVTILDGGGIDRVFQIFFPAVVSISGITIRNGNTAGSGGGVSNSSSLTLTNCTVSGNTSADEGGGISSGGTLTLTNCTVSGNTAVFDGGGVGNSTIISTATLTNVTLSGNVATNGGGIANDGTLTLANSTIGGNTAVLDGGGIRNFGTLTVTNGTFSGNTANQGGGGLANFGSGAASLTNVTLNGNTSPLGGGIAKGLSASATLRNTIVANSPSGGNCAGTLTSLGHNLDSGSTCGFAGPGDLSATAPLLGPLQDNGGPTQTHTLLPGSPAIDAVTSGCPPPVTDQRGIARPQGAACDIGAVEVSSEGGGPSEPPVPQLLNVMTLSGPGGSEQQTFLTTDPLTVEVTFFDPNVACAGVAPVLLQLLAFNLEGQLILTREDVTSAPITPGSKYRLLSATLAPGDLDPGTYTLIFLVRDCTSTNFFVSGSYPILVSTP